MQEVKSTESSSSHSLPEAYGQDHFGPQLPDGLFDLKTLSALKKKGLASELPGRSQTTIISWISGQGQVGADPHTGPTATWQVLIPPTSLPATAV